MLSCCAPGNKSRVAKCKGIFLCNPWCFDRWCMHISVSSFRRTHSNSSASSGDLLAPPGLSHTSLRDRESLLERLTAWQYSANWHNVPEATDLNVQISPLKQTHLFFTNHLEGNICTKCYGNPYNCFRDILLKITNVDIMVPLEEKSC